MNPAIAPPTALGAASAMATAAAPADSSKPGRAINTQPAIRTLGAIPQRRPVTTAPTIAADEILRLDARPREVQREAG